MKFSQLFVLAQVAAAAPSLKKKPLVDPDTLEGTITTDALLAHAQKLENFAYKFEERNRLIGTKAHNKTIHYIYKTLEATGYYNVTKQHFSAYASQGVNSTAVIDGANVTVSSFDFAPNGTVTADLGVVDNLGCTPADYPASVEGTIALISRGECEFGLKAAYAAAAGAVGAIIYNNIPGEFTGGTLGAPTRPEGDYVPVVGLGQAEGQALVDEVEGGATVEATLDVLSFYNEAFTANVIAETLHGDHANVLAMGAHTDSVAAGPGLNDDGSGTVGILETALQLTKYRTPNAVRFGFWAGEEEGLLGSTYYVDSLPAAALADIRLYLNYDMIASPNYYYAAYDGDGSAFNVTGPAGSAQAEHLYERYFAAQGLNLTATEFDGRSDYGPFLEGDIPCGGLFTGAEGIKTPAQAEQFGGEAGVAYDVNYHGAGDNVSNLNVTALGVNTRAIAWTTAFWALSFEELGTERVERRAPNPRNAGVKSTMRMKQRQRFSKRTGKPLPLKY